MYDGSGRRISKTAMRMGGDDGWDTTLVTHYTGIGTEIREYKPRNFVRYTDSLGVEHCVSANPDYGGNASTACPLPDTVKVAVPLPQGLGRYALQDVGQVNENGAPQAFEWYLKNHLGSTMVVYGTGFPDPLGISPEGELRAAYDYRSLGEQLDLLVFTRKVTENFTGKEKDDESQLDYFGARYLDPMLGMWISVDPARQFASPYLYAGNGYNPVNGVDDDGNYYNEDGQKIYESAKKNNFYGNPIVKETLEWGASSPNPINVTISRKDKFSNGYPKGGETINSYSFVSDVLDLLNGCMHKSCSNAFAPDISSSDITIYNGSYNYMQEKGGYSRAGVPIDGMPLEEWQAKTLTHEIDFHVRNDLGQKKNSEDLEHRNKVKDAEMWK